LASRPADVAGDDWRPSARYLWYTLRGGELVRSEIADPSFAKRAHEELQEQLRAERARLEEEQRIAELRAQQVEQTRKEMARWGAYYQKKERRMAEIRRSEQLSRQLMTFQRLIDLDFDVRPVTPMTPSQPLPEPQPASPSTPSEPNTFIYLD
jgi:hypothetical protein